MRALVLVLCGLAACSEPLTKIDAGLFDSGEADAYVPPKPPDAGQDAMKDAGPKPDAGFDDPDTVFEGDQDVKGLFTYFQLQGTMTSTMPPIVIVHDGPGLSHEYLTPHMKSIIRGRFLIFYDQQTSNLTS